MKMLFFVFYKEFLELKSEKRTIALLVLQSAASGLFLPAMWYLRYVGILPGPLDLLDGVGLTGEELTALIKHMLEFIFPMMLPFFMSLIALSLVFPAIAQEVESRILERLLSLPLSWRDLFIGKLLFYFIVSLVCAYIMVLSYFLLASTIVEGFRIVDFHIYLLILVPAVIFYTVSVGLFASARARSVKTVNVTGGFLTSGLFLVVFFVSWALGVELGPDTMLTFGFILFAAGFLFAYYTARVNPEKLLYGKVIEERCSNVQ